MAAGAPFVAWGTFSTDRFEVTRGELASYASSPPVERGFCGTCGTSLTYEHRDRAGEIDVTFTTLDEPGGLAPKGHIWVSDKVAWVELGDGLPHFAMGATD